MINGLIAIVCTVAIIYKLEEREREEHEKNNRIISECKHAGNRNKSKSTKLHNNNRRK